jgi:hypothetical protein
MIRDAAGVIPAAARPAPRQEPRQPPAAEAARAAAQPPPLDPRLRVDAGLNMLVIEFRDAEGEVRASIPSPRELQAYRTAGREAPSLDVTG